MIGEDELQQRTRGDNRQIGPILVEIAQRLQRMRCRLHFVEEQDRSCEPYSANRLQLAGDSIGVQAAEHAVEVQVAFEVHLAQVHAGAGGELSDQGGLPHLPRPAKHERFAAAARQPAAQNLFSEPLHRQDTSIISKKLIK